MKTVLAILVALAVAIPATWFAARKWHRGAIPSPTGASQAGGRKLLYYQSAMHPWIKSDKPGRCTICGMELTPVYEGDPGFGSGGADIVPLTQSMIQVLNVQTAEAAVRPLKKTLRVAGIIDDDDTRHRVLSAYVGGRIERLHVNYVGAPVREGEPLADLYSPTLLQAEREYRNVTGDFRAATALRLRQLGLTPGQIAALPDKPPHQLTSQILAPMSGTVVARYVYEGQYVEEGERLFEIADFSTMWFEFDVYEQDLAWIKIGLKVDITTPAHPGEVFTGHISFIDPNFNEVTRTTKVRVVLPNDPTDREHVLQHQLYAEGIVHLDAPEVLTVPRLAVIETGPEAVVYVDQGGGAYARRVVTLGRRGDSLVEVKNGVAAGEPVVVNGNLLIDGQAEMNRAFAPPVATPAAAPQTKAAEAPRLTDAQRRAVKQLVALTDALGAALAADDLKRFNEEAAKTHTVVPAVTAAFAGDQAWREWIQPIETSGHLSDASTLKEARKAFYPLSSSVASLVKSLRRSEADLAAVKVFRCPMTKDAFEGAPRAAEWIQTQLPIRNPYFGAEMLDCGSEVKTP